MITHYSPTVTVNSFEYITNKNTTLVMQRNPPLGNAFFLFSPSLCLILLLCVCVCLFSFTFSCEHFH